MLPHSRIMIKTTISKDTAAQRAFLSARLALSHLACVRTHLALASTLKEIESNRFATPLLGEAVLPMALSFP